MRLDICGVKAFIPRRGSSFKKQYAERIRLIICLLFVFSVLLFGYRTMPVQAASPITSSGLNTQVSLPSTLPSGKVQYDITGGTRPVGGTNLFHSFGDFNVPSNNIANFLNSSGLATSNILGRVTGGNLSNIFGTIQTTGFGNANLFLMNPAGFLFGPNATVNVGGMVSFTSADYLRLADGKLFNAAPNQAADALLSTAPVAAYGFLGSNPGAITVQGSQLSVTPGQSISLVGGNITVQSGVLDDGVTIQPARLTAPAGQINLASVASTGEILTGNLEQAPNVNGQSFGALGSIQVSQKSVIDSSGYDGGTIRIRGGSLVVDDSTLSANVSGLPPGQPGQTGTGIDIQMAQDVVIRNLAVLETNVTNQASQGIGSGGVRIRADHIEIAGVPDFETFPFFTGIRSNVAAKSAGGKSGDITLDANSILMKDLANLETRTESASAGGNITLTAAQNIETRSIFASISAGSAGGGNAGDIALTSTGGNILLEGAFITSQATQSEETFLNGILSTGNSGNITLSAPHGNVVLTQSFIFNVAEGTTGSLGKVAVTAQNLTLHGDSLIEGDNLTSQVPGNINVMLSGQLSLDGHSLIVTNAYRSAPAADLTITAPQVLVTEGSHLSTETFESGQGGRLSLFTDNLQVTNGGQLRSGSSPFPFDPPEGVSLIPSGGGGAVTVQNVARPAQSIVIDGVGSGIFTDAQGTGAGGSMHLSAQTVAIQNGGVLSASTSGIEPSATGGNISVVANQSVTLSNGGSIIANSTGPGNAGNILVKANDVAISGGGTINAASSGAGTAGTVTIQGLNSPANSFLVDGTGSGVFTNTEDSGAGGNIVVNANTVTMSNGGTLSAKTSGTASSAVGGTITIDAPNSVTMTNGAHMTASSTGPGNTGDIQISSGNQFSMTNSSVTTEANQASGGAIKITTNANGTVQLTDSTISASVLDGNGGGGSVNIDPQYVVLQNSQILANAIFGPGGNINITTNLLLPDSTSVISASSQFGQQGNVIIQSPISPASGKIIPLGQKPLLATTLLSQRCAALGGGNISSFTVAGRDSLPAEPSGWLSSPLAFATAELVGNTATELQTSTSLHESTEAMPVVSLRRIAPPGFLTHTFPDDRTTGCIS